MECLNSCHESIHRCTEQQYFAFAHLYSDEKPMNMHIHDCYEIYYSISGGKQFLIDNRFYNIFPGDVFFINQYESHHLTQIDSQIHERIIFSIYPDFLKSLSTPQVNLEECFHDRSLRSNHKISLTVEEQKNFLYFVDKLTHIQGYGSEILEKAAFMEFMVFLNKRFHKNHIADSETELKGNAQVDSILTYINQHIEEPLSLEQLSSHFYLSSSYLCRVFKSATGTTINKYITAKRISHAKELLAEGCRVSEVSLKCGFNDYSSFFKAFTKTANISPKKYSQILHGELTQG